jgi:hypothetical protein
LKKDGYCFSLGQKVTYIFPFLFYFPLFPRGKGKKKKATKTTLRPPLEWRNCGGILEDLVPIGIIPIKPFGTHDFMGNFL